MARLFLVGIVAMKNGGNKVKIKAEDTRAISQAGQQSLEL